jgi:hypothetical protein
MVMGAPGGWGESLPARYVSCRCAAYPYPHRPGGGDCCWPDPPGGFNPDSEDVASSREVAVPDTTGSERPVKPPGAAPYVARHPRRPSIMWMQF